MFDVFDWKETIYRYTIYWIPLLIISSLLIHVYYGNYTYSTNMGIQLVLNIMVWLLKHSYSYLVQLVILAKLYNRPKSLLINNFINTFYFITCLYLKITNILLFIFTFIFVILIFII